MVNSIRSVSRCAFALCHLSPLDFCSPQVVSSSLPVPSSTLSTQQQHTHSIPHLSPYTCLLCSNPASRPVSEAARAGLCVSPPLLGQAQLAPAPAGRLYASSFCFRKHAKFPPSLGPLHMLLPFLGQRLPRHAPHPAHHGMMDPASPSTSLHSMTASGPPMFLPPPYRFSAPA